MDQVDTLHVGRYMYWSEVLCCTITAHLRDFEVKAMGHTMVHRFSDKAQVRRATLSCDSSYWIFLFLFDSLQLKNNQCGHLGFTFVKK